MYPSSGNQKTMGSGGHNLDANSEFQKQEHTQQNSSQPQVAQHVIDKACKDIRDLLRKKLEIDKNLLELEHKIQLYESSCAELMGIKIMDPENTSFPEALKYKKRARTSTVDSNNVCDQDQRGSEGVCSSNIEDSNYDDNENIQRASSHLKRSDSPSVNRLNISSDEHNGSSFSYSPPSNTLKYKKRKNISITIRNMSGNSRVNNFTQSST